MESVKLPKKIFLYKFNVQICAFLQAEERSNITQLMTGEQLGVRARVPERGLPPAPLLGPPVI